MSHLVEKDKDESCAYSQFTSVRNYWNMSAPL